MKGLAAKQIRQPERVRNKHTATPVSQGKGLFENPVSGVTLQRSPACACGGGCPKCAGGSSIQPKLRINQPGDQYEREADRIADQVMRMPDPDIQRQPTWPFENDPSCRDEEEVLTPMRAEQVSPQLQRQVEMEAEEEAEEEAELDQELQRQAEEDDELEDVESEDDTVFTHPAPGKTPRVQPHLVPDLNSLKGGGQLLPAAVRSYFEPRFGHSFHDVRIHTTAQGARLADGINAKAFTFGREIVFGRSHYAPGTAAGDTLIAHELTHVLQQRKEPVLMRQLASTGYASTFPGGTPAHSVPYPPIYWAIDREKRITLVLPKPGTSIGDVARFLYPAFTEQLEFATVNQTQLSARADPGTALRLTGKRLRKPAINHLRSSTKVRLGVKDPAAYLAKKRALDAGLEGDFQRIVKKLDERHYSDSDEQEVINILKRWGEEPFTTNPKRYPHGGEYLDQMFLKLNRKTKQVGVVVSQWTNYYSLIFNHFDRVDEVKALRDRYSRLFKGDRGLKELSFGAHLWEEVKEGKVRDQIFAYFKGLGKGVWSGAKGTVTMAYNLVTDPKKFFSDMAKLPAAMKAMWEKRNELWRRFANASPEKQAEMIGEVFGEIEFMILTRGASKGVAKLAGMSGKLGKVAQTAQTVARLPQRALGIIAKGVATATYQGIRFAARGAMFAARGVYRVAGKVLRGTWSVVEKVVGKTKKKLYYFYNQAEKKLRQIPESLAKECVHCSTCKLTAKARVRELPRFERTRLPKRVRLAPEKLAHLGRRQFRMARREFNRRHRKVYAKQLDVAKGGQVHHAIELQVLKRYPGVFTPQKLNSLKNMRGIPPELLRKRQLHNSKIREIWNRHYDLLDKKIVEQGLQTGSARYRRIVRQHLNEAAREVDWALFPFYTRKTLSFLDIILH